MSDYTGRIWHRPSGMQLEGIIYGSDLWYRIAHGRVERATLEDSWCRSDQFKERISAFLACNLSEVRAVGDRFDTDYWIDEGL